MCQHQPKLYPVGALFDLPKSNHQQGTLHQARRALIICRKCNRLVLPDADERLDARLVAIAIFGAAMFGLIWLCWG